MFTRPLLTHSVSLSAVQEGLVPVVVHEAAGRERAGGSECALAEVRLAGLTWPSDRALNLLFPGGSEFCLDLWETRSWGLSSRRLLTLFPSDFCVRGLY